MLDISLSRSQKYIKIYHKEETVSQNQNLENHTQLYIMLPRKKNWIIKGIKEAVNLKKNIKQIWRFCSDRDSNNLKVHFDSNKKIHYRY